MRATARKKQVRWLGSARVSRVGFGVLARCATRSAADGFASRWVYGRLVTGVSRRKRLRFRWNNITFAAGEVINPRALPVNIPEQLACSLFCRKIRDVSQSVIKIDPEIMSGAPCFSGTRVPIQNLMDYIEGGDSIDEFLDDFPSVSREQVISFLKEAKESVLARAV